MESLLNKSELSRARDLINQAKKIVIVSHRSPDADAVGAAIAMKRYLQSLEKEVVLACTDQLPEPVKFLDGVDEYVNDFNMSKFHLMISVDCGSLDQVQFKAQIECLKQFKIPFINIDHHITNDNFGDVNIVETAYAATCEILYHFFQFCEAKIDKIMATALLMGIYYDTGSFMHSNTTSGNLDVAAELLSLGADFESIAKHMFKTKPLEQLKIWGLIWNRARINDKNIVISAVTEEDIEQCNAKREYIGGAIDYLNTVEGTKFCMLLTEGGDNNVKASVRTQREDVDLSKLSSIFGGGGHRKASGFTLPGRIEKEIEVKWKISV